MLPKIISDAPITVPATEAQTYPDLYLTDLNLRTGATPEDQQITVGFRAYNYETKQFAPQQFPMFSKTLGVAINVWQESARSDLFKNAMGAVVLYTSLKWQEQSLTTQIVNLRAPYANAPIIPPVVQEQIDALNTQLTDIQTQMGVS